MGIPRLKLHEEGTIEPPPLEFWEREADEAGDGSSQRFSFETITICVRMLFYDCPIAFRIIVSLQC